MNQKKIMMIYSVLILGIIAACLFFSADRSSKYMITMGAVIFSLGQSLALNLLTFKRFRDDPVASIPVIGFGIAHFLIVLLIGFLFGWLLPIGASVYFILQLLLAIAGFILSIGLYGGKNYIMRSRNSQNNYQSEDILAALCRQVKLLQVKSDRLPASVHSVISDQMDQLYELFRYAEPGRNELSDAVDEELSDCMASIEYELDHMIDIQSENTQRVRDISNKIKELMVRRKG
ncbi:MAG: hypothetical protein ACC608_10780 [Anaerofustis sp.]